MSYSAELARRCMKPVDDAARQRAVLHVIDWLGCAAIGAARPMAEALWRGFGLPGAPSLFEGLDGEPTPDPWQTLLFESAVGNILEMDDIHRAALVHPGPVVIPAALFIAR